MPLGPPPVALEELWLTGAPADRAREGGGGLESVTMVRGNSRELRVGMRRAKKKTRFEEARLSRYSTRTLLGRLNYANRPLSLTHTPEGEASAARSGGCNGLCETGPWLGTFTGTLGRRNAETNSTNETGAEPETQLNAPFVGSETQTAESGEGEESPDPGVTRRKR